MFKIIFPVLVLIGAAFFGKYLLETGPEAKKRPFVQSFPVVEVQELKAEQYTVHIEAAGIVTAGTKTNIVSEVSGRVTKIADNFKEGSYFNKNDILLEIDKADYLSAIEIAKTETVVYNANYKQVIAEEKSNLNAVQLAKKNLAIGNKELGRVKALYNRKTLSLSAVDTEEQRVNQLKQSLQNLQGAQSTYASRKNAITAQITASKAKVKQETLRLARATVKAPYAGRILTKNVDIGQFVNTGSLLAESYATDFVNVQLPLSLNQYELLGMPEAFRNKQIAESELPTVVLTNPDSIRKDNWAGKVVRTGAELNPESRQINVIVRVDDPYEAREGISTPIRIGQYLKGRIKGKTFNDVYVLPPVSVLYNREIRLLKDGVIKIVPVNVIWNTPEATIVETTEVIEDELLILTNLTQAIDGMKVQTVEQKRIEDLEKTKNRKKNRKKASDAKAKVIETEEQRKESRKVPDYISKGIEDSSISESKEGPTKKVRESNTEPRERTKKVRDPNAEPRERNKGDR